MRYFDSNFKEIEEDFNPEDTESAFVQQKGNTFVVRKGERSVSLSHSFFDVVSRKKGVTADSLLENASKNYYGNTWKRPFGKFLFILGIFFLVLTTGFYFYRSELREVNFSTEEIPFVSNVDVEIGDYAITDFRYLDGVDIKRSETTSSFGILERNNEALGNTYVLGTHEDIDSPETFVVKYNKDSENGSTIDAFIEGGLQTSDDEYLDILIENIVGEIKPLSSIERLNGETQVLDLFSNSIEDRNEQLRNVVDEYNEIFDEFVFQYLEPQYLLDTTVPRLSFEEYVLYPSYALFGVSGLTFLFGLGLAVTEAYTLRKDFKTLTR